MALKAFGYLLQLDCISGEDRLHYLLQVEGGRDSEQPAWAFGRILGICNDAFPMFNTEQIELDSDLQKRFLLVAEILSLETVEAVIYDFHAKRIPDVGRR